MTPEQNRTIGVIVDCCADIRRLYGAIVLQGDTDTTYHTGRLLSLEDDLAEYCDTAVVQGLDPDFIKGILYRVLPEPRFKQFATT